MVTKNKDSYRDCLPRAVVPSAGDLKKHQIADERMATREGMDSQMRSTFD